ncbi:hypothetical protein [Desulfurivibrio sp. C05AmB]|uniref:hypothetical protein n=1 Tax=Desulfurivibrio sp. C05AmB TaxID=3374371 RepID=UPI00376ED36B
MEWIEKFINFWFRTAAIIFSTVVVIICALLVATNLWLVPLGLGIIAVIFWRRQLADDQPNRPPDLVDTIGQGVTSLLALFATGIGLFIALAVLAGHPWLIIFGLISFWLWRKVRNPARG